jgi:hypothetical protein
MKKDKLYFLTFISITFIYLLIAVVASQFLIKASANQLIEAQVESSKREANEIAKLLDYQLEKGIEKKQILQKTQEIITNSNSDSWFVSVFNWSGTTEVHPDVTRVGLTVDSNQTLLTSLKEKNNLSS